MPEATAERIANQRLHLAPLNSPCHNLEPDLSPTLTLSPFSTFGRSVWTRCRRFLSARSSWQLACQREIITPAPAKSVLRHHRYRIQNRSVTIGSQKLSSVKPPILIHITLQHSDRFYRLPFITCSNRLLGSGSSTDMLESGIPR